MTRIFIDLEFNPTRRKADDNDVIRKEIIEIGAVMLDENDCEISHFNAYVKPQISSEIDFHITKLTGITTEDVENEDTLSDVLSAFLSWCGKDYEMYSWSENDLQQLQEECTYKQISATEELLYMFGVWSDFQNQYDTLWGFERNLSLKNALQIAGIDFEGRAHGALTDARNTANLYRYTHSQKFNDILSKVNEGKNECTVSLGAVFNFAAFNC